MRAVNTSLIWQHEVWIGSMRKSSSPWHVASAMVSGSVRAIQGAEATRSTVEIAVSRTAAEMDIHQGETVNLDHYKALLLAQQRELIARRARTGPEELEPGDGAAGISAMRA